MVHHESQYTVQSIYSKPPMKDVQPPNKDRLIAVTGFLKWYRINSGISRLELSKLSGIHMNTISRYECHHENLTLLSIFAICDALSLDVNQVFLEIE